MLGGTWLEDETIGRSAPFFHLFPTMKKILTLILLSMIAFNAIHADIKWNISADIKWNISIDGTLTISAHFSGFMPDYYNHIDDYKYSYNPAPWYSQRDKIKIVIME